MRISSIEDPSVVMAVHQEFQRQGIGLSLMQYLLAWFDSQSTPCVLLDASDKGQPMYEKFGLLLTSLAFG